MKSQSFSKVREALLWFNFKTEGLHRRLCEKVHEILEAKNII